MKNSREVDVHMLAVCYSDQGCSLQDFNNGRMLLQAWPWQNDVSTVVTAWKCVISHLVDIQIHMLHLFSTVQNSRDNLKINNQLCICTIVLGCVKKYSSNICSIARWEQKTTRPNFRPVNANAEDVYWKPQSQWTSKEFGLTQMHTMARLNTNSEL